MIGIMIKVINMNRRYRFYIYKVKQRAEIPSKLRNSKYYFYYYISPIFYSNSYCLVL